MNRNKNRGFVKLPDELSRVLNYLGIEEKLTAYRVVVEWQSIVGQEVARHTSARYIDFDNQTLVVTVDSPAWMTQLFYLKPRILEKISCRFGKCPINDIRLILKNNNGT